METKDLSLFLAIARIGSISRTADQLYMSQSTVTNRLQRLESTLGYPLFDRTANGVVLTTDGRRMLGLAEQMVQLEEQMTTPTEPTTPVIKVMSGRAFVAVDVPSCLARMRKLVNVHWQVGMGLYDEMVDALLSKHADFCFIGEPIYHPNIRQVTCKPDSIDLVVPEHHVLASQFVSDQFPGLTAITSEPFVAFGRADSPFRKRVMRLLAEEKVYPNVRMELDSFDGVKAMVGHGLGVSLLPRRTLHDAKSKGFVAIPLQGSKWKRPTYLAYAERNQDSPLTKTFIHTVESYYAQLPD